MRSGSLTKGALLASLMVLSGARLAAEKASDTLIVHIQRDPAVLAGKIPGGGFGTLEAGKRQRVLEALEASGLARRGEVEELWLSNSLLVEDRDGVRALLESHPLVAGVFEDEVVTLDRSLQQQIEDESNLVDLAEDPAPPAFTEGLIQIKVPQVRTAYGLTGQGVVVGHLDTGVDVSHPDLAGRVIQFKDFVSDKTDPYDDQGHGTHTAGTICGGDSSGTAIGVAPGARLVVAKVFSAQGTSSTALLLKAMEWIAAPQGESGANRPQLVSNSWGGRGVSEAFRPAVQGWRALEVVPVFSAGNSGPRPETTGIPASYPESFAIGAVDFQDQVASFSSRGPASYDGKPLLKPDVAAPGVDVLSAFPGGKYRKLKGTSMACPHVAGLAALMLEKSPGLAVADVTGLIMGSVVDLGDRGHDNVFGSGRIDGLATVDYLVKGGQLKVLVTDGAKPVDALVKVIGAGKAETTGEDGECRFVLVEKKYKVEVSTYGYQTVKVEVEVRAGQETTLPVALTLLPRGTIAGSVLDANQQPVGARIRVKDAPLDVVRTDPATGAFSVELPAGEHTLVIRAFGHTQEKMSFQVAAGQSTEARVVLKALPEVLVLTNDKEGEDVAAFVTPSLVAAGKSFSTLDLGEEPDEFDPDQIAEYPTILYMTGSRTAGTLSPEMQAHLARHQKLGGRLLMTGEGLLSDSANRKWMSTTFQVGYRTGTVKAREVQSKIGSTPSFRIEGGDGANNQKMPDRFALPKDSPAKPAYLYASAETDIAGVTVKADGVDAVLLGFGFEAIESEPARLAVLREILDQLGGGSRAAFYGHALRAIADGRLPVSDPQHMGRVLEDLVARERDSDAATDGLPAASRNLKRLAIEAPASF